MPATYDELIDKIAQQSIASDTMHREIKRLTAERDAIQDELDQRRADSDRIGTALGITMGEEAGDITARQILRAIGDLKANRDSLSRQIRSLQSAIPKAGSFERTVAQRDILRTALIRYGRHDGRCEMWTGPANPDNIARCTCGLANIINSR